MESLRTTLVIGVGNRFRGDDAVGPIVADRLRSDPLSGVDVAESSGEAAELLDLWEGRDLVIAVDAVESDAPAGTIHCIEVDNHELPVDVFQASTHTFGLAQAVELARALDRLPIRMIVFGVEGANFRHGEPLSESAAAAIETVAQRIRHQLKISAMGERHDA